MEALTSLNSKPPETMSSAGIGSPATISPPSSMSRSTAWPTAGSSPPRLCSSNPSRTSHRHRPRVPAPRIRTNHRVAEMSAVINSVTKAADRDDMLCDDAVSHLNSSSPGCRGSKESWNRGARLNTYRRTVLPRSSLRSSISVKERSPSLSGNRNAQEERWF